MINFHFKPYMSHITQRTTELESVLIRFIPTNAVELACRKLREIPCNIEITEERTSVHGDFRPSRGRSTITINGTLNNYAFLITLMHELAHLQAWELYRNSVKPHGDEWKRLFKKSLGPFLRNGVFPADIERALTDYLSNPLAATCSDLHLSRTLAKYDRRRPGDFLLDEVPANATFVYNDKRTFIKGHKIRTRYHCVCTTTKDVYLFSPLAKVKKV